MLSLTSIKVTMCTSCSNTSILIGWFVSYNFMFQQKQFHNHILKEQEELGRYKVYHEMPIGMEILHATDLTVSGIAHYHPYPVFSREISVSRALYSLQKSSFCLVSFLCLMLFLTFTLLLLL